MYYVKDFVIMYTAKNVEKILMLLSNEWFRSDPCWECRWTYSALLSSVSVLLSWAFRRTPRRRRSRFRDDDDNYDDEDPNDDDAQNNDEKTSRKWMTTHRKKGSRVSRLQPGCH
jgi:hypothetical protein